jgi:hypothetical protein
MIRRPRWSRKDVIKTDFNEADCDIFLTHGMNQWRAVVKVGNILTAEQLLASHEGLFTSVCSSNSSQFCTLSQFSCLQHERRSPERPVYSGGQNDRMGTKEIFKYFEDAW